MHVIKDFGGQDRSLLFNMAAVDEYWRRVTLVAFETTGAYAAIWAGMIGYCMVKDITPDFDYEKVCEWIDELRLANREDEIKTVIDAFAETHGYKKVLADKIALVEKMNSEEIKKKTT